jgi:hypothetical protein
MADLKELFKQAAEIAKQVPENMQEAAFNRALDLLTNERSEKRPTRRNKPGRHSQDRSRKERPGKGSSSEALHVKEPSKKSRKPSTGLGPKSAIVWLIESGFFSTGKTGPAVQDHLRKKRGYDLGTAQLRLAMLRLVREGVLEREENQDGQYEYKQPKPHPSTL